MISSNVQICLVFDSLDTQIKFGRYFVLESADFPGYEIQLCWHHGKNVYRVNKHVSKFDLIRDSYEFLVNEIYEMLNIRDTMIRNVTFWTNCKDVR